MAQICQRAVRRRSRGIDRVGSELDVRFSVRQKIFDVVVFADVVDHLPCPTEVVTQAIRMVKHGGLVLISAPNVTHRTVRLKLLRGRFEYEDTGIFHATHLRWFTAKAIRLLCADAGLDVRSMQQTTATERAGYRRMLPWRIVPVWLWRRLIHLLTRLFPLLVSCQDVLVAQIRPIG